MSARAPGEGELSTRLEAIIATIEAYAGLKFEARAPIGPEGDVVDAVAAGVNFLGEELGVAYAEMEKRVVSRTIELQRTADELRRRVLHDELTGLANRALLLERLSHRLLESDRRPSRFAVIFVDLNDFKGVNDNFGHAAGDDLLRDAATRVRAVLRSADTAARLGGDEFVIVLDEVRTPQSALDVALRLGTALRLPYQLADETLVVSAAIGVALGPGDYEEAIELIDAADAAMYEAKRTGPDACVLSED